MQSIMTTHPLSVCVSDVCLFSNDTIPLTTHHLFLAHIDFSSSRNFVSSSSSSSHPSFAPLLCPQHVTKPDKPSRVSIQAHTATAGANSNFESIMDHVQSLDTWVASLFSPRNEGFRNLIAQVINQLHNGGFALDQKVCVGLFSFFIPSL